MSKHTTLLLMGLLSTGTMAFAQGPPQIVWEADADATNLTFSPDGATMYTGGRNSVVPQAYGNIKRWDVSSTTEVYSLTGNATGAIGLTNALAVTPDGTAFASGHGSVTCPAQGPCTNLAIGFNTWSAGSGTPQFALGEPAIDGEVEAVAFSKDGDFVAFTMSRTSAAEIRVYDYPSFTLQGAYDGHGEGTFCAAFSPTDNILATGGWDGTVQLWDVATNQLLRTLVHGSYTNGGYPVSVAFSPDGSQLAVSGRGYNLEATVWEVSTGNLVYGLAADSGTFGTSSAKIAFSPNGRYLVGAVMRYASPEWQGVIQIWDMVDGSLARMYEETPIGSVGSAMQVAVSPTASDLIAYTYDDKVKFADVDLDLGSGSVGGDGVTFCDPGSTNSTGASAVLSGSLGTGIGSGLHLDVVSGVPGQLAYILVGNEMTGGVVISNGLFCLAGTPTAQFFRYNVAGTDMDSIGGFNASGIMINSFGTSTTGFGFDVPSTIPDSVPIPVMAGDTWNFQCWYRDTPAGVGSSNFSNGLSVTF